MNTARLSRSQISEIGIGAAVLVGLYLTSRHSYLLFHSLSEVFGIVVAWSIFMLVWNARRFLDHGYFLLIGVAFFSVGVIDLFHTLAYAGMGVFPGESANLATQLWIAARYMQSISFLIAPLFVRRKLHSSVAFLAYSAITLVVLASIFYWRIFPVSYQEGSGLTPFKIASEYVICGFLAAALALLLRARRSFDPNIVRLVGSSLAVSIASELAFTSYVSVYDLANMLGHLFKIVAFYLMYKAIIQTGIVKPYDLVFRELKQNENALQAAKEELEQRVAERTAELRTANEQLQVELAERARAEEQVKRLNAELEQRVIERTEKLAQREIALEEANSELEAFAYSVSHDLRAPLRSVQAFSALVLKEYSALLAPEGRRFLELIHGNAQEMDALINGLLTFSRLSRQPLTKQTVDCTVLVRQVLQDTQPEQDHRNVEIVIGDLPTCRADPLLLKQVWANLLSNALKFTRRREQARIEVGWCTQEGKAVYFVKDNGAGFNLEHAEERLFGVFQRFHHAEDYEGTGVGLAIVARIIRRHGGHIWADAEVDKGATFYFTL